MTQEKMDLTAADYTNYRRTFFRHWAKKFTEFAEREDVLMLNVAGSMNRPLLPMYGQQHELIGFKQDGPYVIKLEVHDFSKAGRSLDLLAGPDLPLDAIESDFEPEGKKG